jgi:hypothetical protein
VSKHLLALFSVHESSACVLFCDAYSDAAVLTTVQTAVSWRLCYKLNLLCQHFSLTLLLLLLRCTVHPASQQLKQAQQTAGTAAAAVREKFGPCEPLDDDDEVVSDVARDVYVDVDFDQLATQLYAVRFLQELQRWTATQTSQTTASSGPTAPFQRVFYHLTHWCAYYASSGVHDKLKLAKFAHGTLYRLMTQSGLDVGTAGDDATVKLLAAWEADITTCSKSARSRLNEVCKPVTPETVKFECAFEHAAQCCQQCRLYAAVSARYSAWRAQRLRIKH